MAATAASSDNGAGSKVANADTANLSPTSASAQAAQLASLQGYASTAITDLNDDNYAGALQAGLDSGKLYDTNYGSTTTDPLLAALESSQGLQELDPTKQWNAQSIQQYYNAFGANSVTTGTQAGTADAGESWGKNAYGVWGDPSKIASDAATNISTQGDNSAPDLERFVGAKPTTSFLGKYGVDIAALAATAVSFGVAAPALAGALAADGVASGLAAGAIAGGVVGGVNAAAVDAITGKPLTLGSVAGGALGGAAGGGLMPLAGGAINNATGIGSTLSSGIAGAGIGAAKSALSGGNVGLGALTGGIGGAVQGSGVAGNIKGALTSSGVPTALAGGVTNAGINYAVGGATGAAAGLLMGNQSGSQPSAQGTNGNMATTSTGSATQLQGSTIAPSTAFGAQQATGTPTAPQLQSINTTATAPQYGQIAAPTSTDSTLASTIGGAVPGLLSTAAGAYGSQNAAQAQQNADQAAIGTQQTAMGNINGIYGAQAATGNGADAALSSSLGLGGAPADPSNFLNMPGYQFAVSQGTQAIQRQASAMGSAYTPNTAEAVGSYVTGTAAQDYNTYISQLMGAAGLGSTANQGLAAGQLQTGGNISQLQQNIGQAQAAGVSGVSNAVAGAFSPNGAGTSLVNGATKALTGSTGTNSAGVPNGNGSGVSNSSDPFAGTPEANNQNSMNAYNQNNAPTSGDISNTVNSNLTTGNINDVPAFDPNSITMPSTDIGDLGLGDDFGYDGTSFLGDY